MLGGAGCAAGRWRGMVAVFVPCTVQCAQLSAFLLTAGCHLTSEHSVCSLVPSRKPLCIPADGHRAHCLVPWHGPCTSLSNGPGSFQRLAQAYGAVHESAPGRGMVQAERPESRGTTHDKGKQRECDRRGVRVRVIPSAHAVFFPRIETCRDRQIERPYGKDNLLVCSSSQQSEGRASRAAQPEMGPPF